MTVTLTSFRREPLEIEEVSNTEKEQKKAALLIQKYSKLFLKTIKAEASKNSLFLKEQGNLLVAEKRHPEALDRYEQAFKKSLQEFSRATTQQLDILNNLLLVCTRLKNAEKGVKHSYLLTQHLEKMIIEGGSLDIERREQRRDNQRI